MEFTKEQLISRIGVLMERREESLNMKLFVEEFGADVEILKIALAWLEAEPVPEWTNEQCLEFLSIAFRHAEIKGDLQLDDIRLGVKMVNACRAATPVPSATVDELTMWVKRLTHSLRSAKPDSNLPDEAMAYLSRKGLISVTDILR